MKTFHPACFILVILFAQPSLAISLHFPVDCQLNNTCYIQQYVDHQPKLGGRDFKGGQLSSENHRGTDIALANYTEMKKGIAVLAAASGKVLRVRDKSVDNTRINYDLLSSRDCGNGIVIQHDNHWQTQYCHLKRLSLRVKPGQEVKAGDVIAEVGSSGQADYPALEFIVTQNDKVIDPFQKNLWKNSIHYQGSGLIDMGITLTPPNFAQLIKSPIKVTSLSLANTAIYPWVRIFGAPAEAKQRFVFYDNDGKIFRTIDLPPINQFYPAWFAYTKLDIDKKIGPDKTGNWKVAYQLQYNKQDWQTIGEIPFLLTFYMKTHQSGVYP